MKKRSWLVSTTSRSETPARVSSLQRIPAGILLVLAFSWGAACVPGAERLGSLRVFDRQGQGHGFGVPGELGRSALALPPAALPYEIRPVGPSKYLIKTWSQGSFLLDRGRLVPLRGLPRSRVWTDDGRVVQREVHDMKELAVPDDYPSAQVRPILALNDHDVLISLDGGATFRKWPSAAAEEHGALGLPKQSLLLSAAFWQQSAAVLDYSGERAAPGLCAALGTGHGGVYISCDGGFHWTRKSDGLPGLPSASPVAFHEGIRALHAELATKTLYAGTDLGAGAYRSGLSAESAFAPVALGRFADRFAKDQCSIGAISSSPGRLYLSGDCQPLVVHTHHDTVQAAPLWSEGAYVSFYRYFARSAALPPAMDGQVGFRTDEAGGFYTYDNPSAIPRRVARAFPYEPGACRGFYISPTSSMTRLKEIRALLEGGKFNCVVVDMKDDLGRVPVEVTTPLTERYGTRRSDWSLAALWKLLSDYHVWKIARHVTMKDRHLSDATSGRLALREVATNGPWLSEDQDKWSDPFSEEVWEYNAEIASTYESLGFDEVQFDYIRFPSEETVSVARVHDTYESEALASFLSYARKKTRLPVSIDIYGYNALYRIDSPVGQNMQLLGEYVDVVSPMVYSSHFDDRYLSQGHLEDRAYNLLLHSTGRANAFARGRFVIRSWLQAFRMKTDVWGYGRAYFDGQTHGCLDGGSTGWLWWGTIEEMFGLP